MLRGMWDLPRPGLEPVSPASAGRFSTTAPPGKPYLPFLKASLKLALGLAQGALSKPDTRGQEADVKGGRRKAVWDSSRVRKGQE